MKRSIEDYEDLEALAALWAASLNEDQFISGLLEEEL